MTEDVILTSSVTDVFPLPCSQRLWSSVFLRARTSALVHRLLHIPDIHRRIPSRLHDHSHVRLSRASDVTRHVDVIEICNVTQRRDVISSGLCDAQHVLSRFSRVRVYRRHWLCSVTRGSSWSFVGRACMSASSIWLGYCVPERKDIGGAARDVGFRH